MCLLDGCLYISQCIPHCTLWMCRHLIDFLVFGCVVFRVEQFLSYSVAGFEKHRCSVCWKSSWGSQILQTHKEWGCCCIYSSFSSPFTVLVFFLDLVAVFTKIQFGYASSASFRCFSSFSWGWVLVGTLSAQWCKVLITHSFSCLASELELKKLFGCEAKHLYIYASKSSCPRFTDMFKRTFSLMFFFISRFHPCRWANCCNCACQWVHLECFSFSV